MRPTKKILILITGVVVAVAGVVAFAANAAARRSSSGARDIGHDGIARSVRAPAPRRACTASPRSRPASGCAPGAVSPSAAGIGAAAGDAAQARRLPAGGPAGDLQLRGAHPAVQPDLGDQSRPRSPGVIFFSGNVGSACPHQGRRHANCSRRTRPRPTRSAMPLLLMTDQEGGVVRRLPGAPGPVGEADRRRPRTRRTRPPRRAPATGAFCTASA